MKAQLYIVINSSIGKIGNVGFRTAEIIKELDRDKYSLLVFARFSKIVKNLNFNSYEFFSRGLNFLRIYFFRTFDSAKFDNHIFEMLEKFIAQTKVLEGRFSKRIIHLWSPHYCQMIFYKNLGYKIILDVPIATFLHANAIAKETDYSFDLDVGLVEQERAALRLSDIIIAPSMFVKKGIICHYGIAESKVKVVPFGVDYSKFYVQRKLSKKKDGLTYIFTGALNIRKGLHTLLEAWNDPSFRNDRLVLCGRLFPDVKAHIDKLKDVGEIVVPGTVDVPLYLQNSDIFVFPSYMEGSAKSVYEAMASGLPVITTDNAGTITHDRQTGLIIKAGDVATLRERMILLKVNPVLRYELGVEAQSKVSAYSWSRYGEAVVAIYDGLLE